MKMYEAAWKFGGNMPMTVSEKIDCLQGLMNILKNTRCGNSTDYIPILRELSVR